MPVNTKCNKKRKEFNDKLKEKAAENPFATYTEPKEDPKDVCILPKSGDSCSNDGCCPNDQYVADGVFCTLLEGSRAGSMCRMGAPDIPSNPRAAWDMLVKRLCRTTRRTWGVSKGETTIESEILFRWARQRSLSQRSWTRVPRHSQKKCKTPCIWSDKDYACTSPPGESSGRVSAIELDKGSEFPPQTFMDTKTNTGTGSGCQLSTSLLFKEGEAIVRALDANFIPNDSGINRAGTAPDASGQYRIFDYNNFSKIDSTTRTNFVRACMDIVAPVCRQPSTVDLSSQGDNEQQAKDKGKNMGLLIAIVSVLVLGLGVSCTEEYEERWRHDQSWGTSFYVGSRVSSTTDLCK